jgi:hypothetical protein
MASIHSYEGWWDLSLIDDRNERALGSRHRTGTKARLAARSGNAYAARANGCAKVVRSGLNPSGPIVASASQR